jgi:hypothetical protein
MPSDEAKGPPPWTQITQRNIEKLRSNIMGINSAYRLMFVLPGYSPELSPDELLNQNAKSNTIRKNKPSHQDELN